MPSDRLSMSRTVFHLHLRSKYLKITMRSAGVKEHFTAPGAQKTAAMCNCERRTCVTVAQVCAFSCPRRVNEQQHHLRVVQSKCCIWPTLQITRHGLRCCVWSLEQFCMRDTMGIVQKILASLLVVLIWFIPHHGHVLVWFVFVNPVTSRTNTTSAAAIKASSALTEVTPPPSGYVRVVLFNIYNAWV